MGGELIKEKAAIILKALYPEEENSPKFLMVGWMHGKSNIKLQTFKSMESQGM